MGKKSGENGKKLVQILATARAKGYGYMVICQEPIADAAGNCIGITTHRPIVKRVK